MLGFFLDLPSLQELEVALDGDIKAASERIAAKQRPLAPTKAEQLIGFDPASLPRWQPGAAPWLEYVEDGPHEISKAIRRQLAKRKRLAAAAAAADAELSHAARAPPPPEEDSRRMRHGGDPLNATSEVVDLGCCLQNASSTAGDFAGDGGIVELAEDPSGRLNDSGWGSPIPRGSVSSVTAAPMASPDAEML